MTGTLKSMYRSLGRLAGRVLIRILRKRHKVARIAGLGKSLIRLYVSTKGATKVGAESARTYPIVPEVAARQREEKG